MAMLILKKKTNKQTKNKTKQNKKDLTCDLHTFSCTYQNPMVTIAKLLVSVLQ